MKAKLITGLLLALSFRVIAQDNFERFRQRWLQIAQESIPALKETIRHPTGIVELHKDPQTYQGWKASKVALPDSLYNKSFNKKKEIIVDFGEHITGYVSIDLISFTRTPDAPVRLKLTFGEVPSEVAVPFDPYTGDLSRAWLQDEVVTVSDIPTTVSILRRVAFRYIKIELLGSSRYFDFTISDVRCRAVTSATTIPEKLPFTVSPMTRTIDSISLTTLKECMQTVYEDGPKRDRRLWIGDFYLESLANEYSFKNFNLTKRCLYLLAALSSPNGNLYGTVFERPYPHAQEKQFLMDYALLYNAALRAYVKATGDDRTGHDLWPVAKKQLEIIKNYLTDDGIIDYDRANNEWWLFFDWKDGLNKEAALQGLAIFSLRETRALAVMLGMTQELPGMDTLIKRMTDATRKRFYDQKMGMVVSGPEKQISYLSQIWLTLAGVLTRNEAQQALKKVTRFPGAIYPGGPYAYHYYVQALLDAGLNDEAKTSLRNYWGGMVNKGADTFWEVYDPQNDYVSPYHFFQINSYCHAWSCTPIYFIRKYPKVFN